MTPLAIDLTRTHAAVLSGPLRMGGANPDGVAIQANSRYLTKGGRPWLPVMGEMHYTRCPSAGWRTELLKMKMGGIQVVATYVFWIHHEELEGEFDWTGQRNLREFIRTCAACGLLAFPRIGPWAHGECRNGGFPDWLLARGGARVRQDDPLYLGYVHILYGEIARQLDGLLWKDGGPVIGIQVENELLHDAAHLMTLKGMARGAGLDVPLYTQTGWGPAELTADELLPVFGGYPDAFWERHVDDWARGSRKHYFFSPVRDENTIGTDLLRPVVTLGAEREAQLERYPYGTCECGGGMPAAYHRRPVIRADDVAALAMAKIGSGSNLQGYYMYHGGSNPEGKRTVLQESQATGYPNDLPTVSYDFQAPLREYGQASDSYHALRPLHLFLADFGERLAPLPLAMPDVVPDGIDDRHTLRWAARSDGRQAFLFVNNYQRREGLPEHAAVQFEVCLRDGTLRLPARPARVAAGAWCFWPVNFDLDGLLLKYASAQPVCRVTAGEGPLYVFAAQPGIEPEFAFEAGMLADTPAPGARRETANGLTVLSGLQPGPDCVLDLCGALGQRVRLLVLRREEALRLYKGELDGAERLLLSPAGLFVDGNEIHLRSREADPLWLAIYPDVPGGLRGGGGPLAAAELGVFTRYAIAAAPRPVSTGSPRAGSTGSPRAGSTGAPAGRRVEATRLQAAAPAKPVRIGPAGVATVPDEAAWGEAETWQVGIPSDVMDDATDAFLVIDYVADVARAWLGGRLVADDFYNGRPWEIGLRRFMPQAAEQGLTLRFLPMRRDAPVYVESEFRPDFGNGDSIVRVRSVRIEVEIERVLRVGRR